MNGRMTIGVLSLTLLMAACGQQGTSAPQTQAAADDSTQSASKGQALAPLLVPKSKDTIPGQYLVMFKDDAQAATISTQSAGDMVRSLGLDPQGVSVKYTYTKTLKGFAGKLSTQNLNTLRVDKRVKYIEQDAVVHTNLIEMGVQWGKDRVDQQTLPLDNEFHQAKTTAGNVTAYVIDTGILASHSEFNGLRNRVTWGTNTTGDGQDADCNGHGTHVAGILGGSNSGIAENVNLVAVKVLGCDGSGTITGVVAGINWVANNATGPSVANMSFGTIASQSIDDAVNAAIKKNVTVVVAAGNDNTNACTQSPARVPDAITVGSTTKTDTRSSFSNYGSCVDLFAPGSDITSAWNTSDNATKTLSGTSMASPNVAGVAALILSQNPTYTPAQLASAVTAKATAGVLKDIGAGSPNLLAYMGPGTNGPAVPTNPPPLPLNPNPLPPTMTIEYSGSVTDGQTTYKPYASGFYTPGSQLHAQLGGPDSNSGKDFDLFLSKQVGNTWVVVAASQNTGTSVEEINYPATSGIYRWEVRSIKGSDVFLLDVDK